MSAHNNVEMDLFELSPPTATDNSPSNPARLGLRLRVEEFIRELLKREEQPAASELLEQIEKALGWAARWEFWLVVVELREDATLRSYCRNYLKTVLSDAEISAALAGGTDLKEIHRSTLDDLFRRSNHYRNSAVFREMIEFIAKFRNYAPYNNLLVKIQHPACSFFATEKDWKRNFDRVIKDDARPLLILAPMHPVMAVYDLDATEGPPLPQRLLDFARTEGEWDDGWMKNLLSNARRDLIQVDFKELSSTLGGFATTRLSKQRFKMRVAIHNGLNEPSAFGVLCHELAHIYLGHLGGDSEGWWPSRINLTHATVEIEAEATSYIVGTQLGLKQRSESYLASYVTSEEIPASVSVELITKVAGKLLDMAKRKLPPRK